MIRLHYYPGNASLVTHVLLEHVGNLARLVAARPAFVRAMEQEKLGEPYFG